VVLDAEVLTIANPILAGLGLAPLAVPIFPVEDHVAQKLRAYSRLHGPSGRPSTQGKDLIDLVLIARAQLFLAHRLRAALAFVSPIPRRRTWCRRPRPTGAPHPRGWRVRSASTRVCRQHTRSSHTSWTRCSTVPPGMTIAGCRQRNGGNA